MTVHRYAAGLPAEVVDFIGVVPKAELHLHIEGTLEPELLLALAERNALPAPFPSVEAARAAYDFSNLQSFLDLYYQGAAVLRTEKDFYDLAWAYFERVAQDNVVHTEVFFDPQTHLLNGRGFEVFMPALKKAAEDAGSKLGITVHYIMCFLRDRSEEEALEVLEQSKPYLADIKGVGLDSAEHENPPRKFLRLFDKATALGLLPVAHAGEEGPPAYVWEAIKELKVQRIDHGVRSLEDPQLMEYLRQQQLPLTVCPLSNLKLKVYSGFLEERLSELLRSGLCITVNSDDPAYFLGYMVDNYEWLASVTKLGLQDIATLAKNSFTASFFLTAEQKQAHKDEVDRLFADAVLRLGSIAASKQESAADEAAVGILNRHHHEHVLPAEAGEPVEAALPQVEVASAE